MLKIDLLGGQLFKLADQVTWMSLAVGGCLRSFLKYDDPGQRVLHDIDAQRLIPGAFEAALVDDSPTRALLPGLRLSVRLLATVFAPPVIP